MKSSALHKLLALTLTASGLLAQTAFALITIETVPVGNAGNTADPTTGYGAVGYDYGIGKYEVTLNQYNEFLNAVAKTDTYGLYNTQMGALASIMGISRSGTSGSFTYSVIGSGNHPVTYVSWYDSARFVNWLHNGQPVGLQAAGTTETGAYTLTGNTGISLRNSGWVYGLPSENEWYKAAYHQPWDLGGDSDNYWLYPMANNNNAIPRSRNGSTSDNLSANYWWDDGIANGFNGGYAVTGVRGFSSSQNYLADVCAFSLADSFYGTFDQAGNAMEWNDAIIGSGRGLRGGAWNHVTYLALSSGNRTSDGPGAEANNYGFRIVMIPEPSVAGMIMLGMALVAWKRK
jgi:sulfatase modifying factor 1